MIKSGIDAGRSIQLKLGVNRLGRLPSNEIQITDPSISSMHCELELLAGEISIRDCDSTNGTFIDGVEVASGTLRPGQTLRVGNIELVVEKPDFTVAIPRFEIPRPAPPVVLVNGSIVCPRHAGVMSTHRCTRCREVMCSGCVKRIGRRGGKRLELCPSCSHFCEQITPEEKKPEGFLGFLQRTIRLPLTRKKEHLTVSS